MGGDARKAMIKNLEGLLYEVQYAKPGTKAATRKALATEVVDAIITAYKINKGMKI